MFCLTLLMVLGAVINSHARPDGGPKTACASLTPVHYDIKPQTDLPPYTVSVEKSGNKFTVTISSSIGEEFVGFMLQARSKDDPTKFIDGEFTTSAVTKTTDCFNGEKNTLTHINPDPKRKVVTEWTPKGAVHGNGIFKATVAKTFDIFWTDVDSSPVEISSDGAMPEAGTKSDSHSMYDNCFVSKGCFGYPAGCAQQGDCEVLLTYSTLPDGIRFGMHGYLDSSMYMAMGLSDDGVMGGDSVTECIRDGSTVIARESWNEGKSNTRTKELPKSQYTSSFTNGLSSCYWKSPFVSESNGRTFDLAGKNYFILLAKGEVANGALKYHAGRLPSGGAVNFTAFEAIEGEGTSDSVKVHGDSTEHGDTTPGSFETDEHEAHPTGHREAKSTSTSKITPAEDNEKSHNGSSQLSFSLLLAVLHLFYAIRGTLFASLA